MALRIDIINNALVRLGAAPIQSETLTGTDAYVMIYDTVIGALVSRYPWSFQTKFAQLGRLLTPPLSQWQYGYQLPADLLGTPRAVYASVPTGGGWPELPVTAFEIMGDTLFTNETQIWLRYTFALSPARWPGYFTELAVMALAAEYAISVREDAALRNSIRTDVYGSSREQGEGGMLAEAKAIDASSQPSRTLSVVNPLTAGRYTGFSRDGYRCP